MFVAAGDTGTANDDPIQTETGQDTPDAVNGYAVNGFASTAYNVAVGGTMFDEGGNPNYYWSPTNYSTETSNLTFTSALHYIPENAWNGSGTVTGGSGIGAGGGGISQCNSLPPWQAGSSVPTQDPTTLPDLTDRCDAVQAPHRYLPDVSLSAEGYFICWGGNCDQDSGSQITPIPSNIVGGTSASTPAFAGIQALINEWKALGNDGDGRQGQANYVYYALAQLQGSSGSCYSNASPADSQDCVFHDIYLGSNGSVSTNAVPCQSAQETVIPANFSH